MRLSASIRRAGRPRPWVRRTVAGTLLVLLSHASLAAQQPRRYLVELGVGGGYQSFPTETSLEAGPGAAIRVGLWLPMNLSIEAEGTFFSTQTEPQTITQQQFDWTANSFGASVLYNFRLGALNSAFLRGGYARLNFDADRCEGGLVPVGPCGGTNALTGGGGLRIAITPAVQLRADVYGVRGDGLGGFTFGGGLGASIMLGARTIGDRDGDGVFDNADRCPGTPGGVLVDARGCPTDTDGDKVPDGVDRCPRTPPGSEVDAVGCPRDGDQDGVPDGADRCPDTPSGAAVNQSGCPIDSDDDGVADGLDRCADTPEGAVVDALGCPGDEDSDGVLDGIDRCPRTPGGTPVNAFGCPPGQSGEAPPADSGAGGPGASAGRDGWILLRGVAFAPGSARLLPGAQPVLDSVAAALEADPALQIEIAGHADLSGEAGESEHTSRLRAEAVRDQLIRRGIPFRRMTARGYGSMQPLTRDRSPEAQARNRRVEIRPAAPRN